MKTEKIQELFRKYEHAACEVNGVECWSAKELGFCHVSYNDAKLSYNAERNACKIAGYEGADHFLMVRRKKESTNNKQSVIVDFLLTQYACYLFARKLKVGESLFALSYFAVKERHIELIEQRIREVELQVNTFPNIPCENERNIRKVLSGIQYERGMNDMNFATIRPIVFGQNTAILKHKVPIPENNSFETISVDYHFAYDVNDFFPYGVEGMPIDKEGNFYKKFSNKKYDSVILVGRNLYKCSKNGRYGLIDEKGKHILHTCYNGIQRFDNVIIARTETGAFLFNIETHSQSEEYDNLFYGNYQNVLCERDGKFGLLNCNCEEIIKPLYERREIIDDGAQLLVNFQGKKYGLLVKDNLFWGLIPLIYDYCIKVPIDEFGGFTESLHITQKNSKYGILNWSGRVIAEPILDDVIFWKKPVRDLYCEKDYKEIIPRVNFGIINKGEFYWKNYTFIIGKNEKRYCLFNAERGNSIIEHCEKMEYHLDDLYENIVGFVSFEKGGTIGYVGYEGNIVSTDKYDTITPSCYLLIVSQKGKFGIVDGAGNEVIPCVYNRIQSKEIGVYVAERDGKEEVIIFRDKRSVSSGNTNHYGYYGTKQYFEFAGTYAQEQMGYSDEEIWDLFDGEPEACWNLE